VNHKKCLLCKPKLVRSKLSGAGQEACCCLKLACDVTDFEAKSVCYFIDVKHKTANHRNESSNPDMRMQPNNKPNLHVIVPAQIYTFFFLQNQFDPVL
jgi:hypothetical protein